MCDTIVALPRVTKDHKVYFAKNSDREPNEAQYIQLVPGNEYAPEENVQCTYISIPQVRKTNTVLLSKPFWMWGAEMGVNEHGVAIGNEAVFTKIKPDKKPGLIGMDFLRLALERSECAEEALNTITNLLKEYGQSGNCSYAHQLFYHNSFLIADRSDAWVLETAGKHWAAVKIKDFYSISNSITIRKNWDLASEDLVRYAIEKRWCKNPSDFDFKKCYSDFLFTKFSQANKRREFSFNRVKTQWGQISLETMFNLLRSHSDYETSWKPDRSFTEWTICVHKGFGPIRASQTTGSMVSRLSDEGDLHFMTGTSAPCTGIFKPLWIDSALPKILEEIPSEHFDNRSLWWKHEILHREVLRDFRSRINKLASQREMLEKNIVEKAQKVNGESKTLREKVTQDSFFLSWEFTNQLIREFQVERLSNKQNFFYQLEWNSHNKKAEIY